MKNIPTKDILDVLSDCQDMRAALYQILYEMVKEKATKEDFENACHAVSIMLESIEKMERNPKIVLEAE